MIRELSLAFGETAVGVSVIVGIYYYTYSIEVAQTDGCK
jgi:NADH:ubiquinone oxidoreductase subunit K